MVQPPWGRQEGWRQGAGRGRLAEMGSERGNIFFPPTGRGCLAPTWGPTRAPRPPGVSQLLGVKGNKESRWSTPTPTPTPTDLRPEETWGGVTRLTAYTESEAVPGCQSLGSPIPCPPNERPRPGGARGAHRSLSSDRPPVWARHFSSARLRSPVCKRESLLLPRLP